MLVVDSALTTWKISSLRALGLIAYLLKIGLECWFSLNCAVVQIRFYNRCGLHTLLWRSFHLIYDMLMAFCLRIVFQRAFTVHCILLHPRFALALRCSLRVVRGPFVSAFNATSKKVPELYKGRQCISTLSWSLSRIHSSHCYASSGCEIMRFISTELCCVLS